jgi:uncharacterized phage-associated protein
MKTTQAENSPVTVDDVAAYVLKLHGEMTSMKLQKLAYYSQVWHIVWEENLLFKNRIEAWANGPVIPDLYYQHKGRFTLSTWPSGDPSKLLPDQKETIEKVVKHYGSWTAQQLSDQAHNEAPWIDARQGLAPLERGTNEITPSAIEEYYCGL